MWKFMCGKYDSSRTVKGKATAAYVHVVRAHSRSSSTAPVILNLGKRWWWAVIIKPRPLYPPPGKEHRYPLNRSLVGPQNKYGRWREEKISCYLPGFEVLIIQTVSHSLQWLQYSDSKFASSYKKYPFCYYAIYLYLLDNNNHHASNTQYFRSLYWN